MARRKAGDRYPGGRLKPKPEEWLPYRREYLQVNRVRDGRGIHVTMKSEGSGSIDRLLFRGLVTGKQCDAADDLRRIWTRYRVLFLGMGQPLARLSWGELGVGYPHDDRCDPQAASLFYAAVNALRRSGEKATNTVFDVVLYDAEAGQAQLLALRRGLNMLVGHFKRW